MRNKIIFKIEMTLAVISIVLIGCKMFGYFPFRWLYALLPLIILGAIRNSIIIGILVMNLINYLAYGRKKD